MKMKIVLVVILSLFFMKIQAQELVSQLVFNQPFYTIGDTAYFSLRMIEGDKKLTGILKMNVFDDKRSVQEVKFKVTDGQSANQVAVPNDLIAGSYPLIISNENGQELMRSHLNVGGVESSKLNSGSSVRITMDHQKSWKPREKSVIQVNAKDASGNSVDGYLTASILSNQILNDRPISTTSTKTSFKLSPRMVLKGRLRDKVSKELLPYGTSLMLYFQKSRLRYLATVRESGYFESEILDYYGDDELFLIAETPDGKILSAIEVEWDVNTISNNASVKLFANSNTEYTEFMTRKRLMDESYGFYTTQDTLMLEVSKGNALDIIKPDYRVKPVNFVKFKNMGEFLKTIVDPVWYGELDGKESVRVKYLKPYEATSEPLYVIDGIVTLDTDYFLSLDQDAIDELIVIQDYRKLVRYGLLGKNGIVIIKSKNGNLRPPVDTNKVLKGLSEPKRFPELSTLEITNSNRPYFSANIAFQTRIKVENGKALIYFTNMDNLGDHTIYIEGLTSKGESFSAESTYKVLKGEQ